MSWISRELISGMASLPLAASPVSCTDCTQTSGTTSCHAPLVTVVTREVFARYLKKKLSAVYSNKSPKMIFALKRTHTCANMSQIINAQFAMLFSYRNALSSTLRRVAFDRCRNPFVMEMLPTTNRRG